MALLIDADIIAYRAASSVEQEKEMEDDVWVLYTDLSEARLSFNTRLASLVESCPSQKDFILCFSDGENFRKQLNPEYKANRKKTRKPMGYKKFIEQLRTDFKDKAVSRPRLEADDCLGILATRPNTDHVIWSVDKDLRQIPCKHLSDEGEVTTVSQVDGDLFFLKQVLTGDTVDNYKGLPGTGPVKAAKIVQDAIDANAHLSGDAINCVWPAIVAAYIAAGLTEADALLQARMAHILRYPNWNPKTEGIRLWTPTNTM